MTMSPYEDYQVDDTPSLQGSSRQVVPPHEREGRCLVIDLDSRSWRIDPIASPLLEVCAGGRLLALALYEKYVRDTATVTARYEQGNPMVFACGMITGYEYMDGGFSVVTRSPVTRRISVAYSDTAFGRFLRFCSYDALVLSGRLHRSSVIVIDEKGVSFMYADKYYEATTAAMDDALGACANVTVLSIGAAGEHGVACASLVCQAQSIGRGGLGAVMGLKNIKAISISARPSTAEDGVRIPAADRKAFTANFQRLRRRIRLNPVCRALARYGSAVEVTDSVSTGTVSINNFTYSADPRLRYLGGQEQLRLHGQVRYTIFSRLLPDIASPASQNEPGFSEAIMLGSHQGIFDPDIVRSLLAVCVEQGMDPVSAGGMLGWVRHGMEAGAFHDAPFISAGESFVVFAARLLRDIALCKNRAIGFAGGIDAAAQAYGHKEFAFSVRGLELGPYDIRSARGQALVDMTGYGGSFMAGVIQPALQRGSVNKTAAWVVHDESVRYGCETMGLDPCFGAQIYYWGRRGASGRISASLGTFKLLHAPFLGIRMMAHRFMPGFISSIVGHDVSYARVLLLGRRARRIQERLDKRLNGSDDDCTAADFSPYFSIIPTENGSWHDVLSIRPLRDAYRRMRHVYDAVDTIDGEREPDAF
ncbi:aldehyde ferredoxin oxidoreductase N-terminal domain-containing protein [Parasphaerochaeta coccoides]|uniref:Aldehyde ferredoxin oxidoreductase n=1 Tax=Parasphaerochaeta coccoides (strain ATCC BAA-1237 / DSM 17374 / SPN1) TaxID=760011 RepID=F4GLP4_PARC1|nr:aldehyde ferredoxin oxidoreductase N-terminal domain-containing protein [Parasphaerochaeta coccoides]AEC02438.1 Aldehyde ferredoxin oxidoreductase [Parasphaerochaeta coccoides DSM 17374]